jgi:hypothetical protein
VSYASFRKSSANCSLGKPIITLNMPHTDKAHSGHATDAPLNDATPFATRDRIPRDDDTHGKDTGAHDKGKHAAAAAMGITKPAGYEHAPQYDGDVTNAGVQKYSGSDTQTFIVANALGGGGAAPPAAPIAQELQGQNH